MKKFLNVSINRQLLELALNPEDFVLGSKSGFMHKLLIEHLEKKGFKKEELLGILKNGE